jgi:hypothetical protein
MPSGSLLKNDHLRRFSWSTPLAGSPTRRRGKQSLLIRRDATLRISGAPANGISQGSTCICLPARSRFGEGRVLFEQPAKDDFFSSLQNHYTLKFESRSTKKSKKLQYLRR